jgi:GTP pyrophosphokinase
VGQVDGIALAMKHVLSEAGLKVEVTGREKHPYSIWRKMSERHVTFDQITDIMAFRIICENEGDCYRAMGVLHTTWQFLPGRFKDYISTPKTNGYRSLHTALMYENSMRVEVQIRTREMHRLNEFGLAAHWAYKQGDKPDGQVGWLRDLIEIVDASHDAEELLEHTRMAIYQDRIFAFTPEGRAVPAAQRRDAGGLRLCRAYQAGAANGGREDQRAARAAPLATGEWRRGGDRQERGAEPQLSWLSFVVTGKARAAIRRAVRAKERAEIAELGQKLFDEIANRVPARIGKKRPAPPPRASAWMARRN